MTVADHMPLRQHPPFAAPFPSMRASRLPFPVLLYLLAVVIPIGFNAGPLALTLLRVVLLVMVIPLMIGLLSGRYGRVFLIDVLFILHLLWATVALAVNNPDRVVENIGAAGVEFLGGYLLGRAYIRTAADFLALCRALAIIVCCTFPFALIETMTGRPLLLEAIRSLPGVTTAGLNFQEGRLGLERVQFGFAHPIHYGLFCAVAFSLAFVGLKGSINGSLRYVASAAIGLCGFLALSSGALLALVLQLGLIVWAWIFAGVRSRWWLLLGFFVIAWIVIDLLSNRSPFEVFMSYATFSAHTAYWRGIIFEWGLANVVGSAEKGIVGSPLFGIGLNDWVRPWYMYSGSMDNFWLVMAVRYGVPGLLFLAVGYVWAIARIMRRDFADDAVLTQIRRAWVFTFFGLTFTLCTVHVWTSIYSFVFFVLGAGMWMILAEASSGDPALATGPPRREKADGSGYTRFPIRTGPRRIHRGDSRSGPYARGARPDG